jgi:hypothetical protein
LPIDDWRLTIAYSLAIGDCDWVIGDCHCVIGDCHCVIGDWIGDRRFQSSIDNSNRRSANSIANRQSVESSIASRQSAIV